MSPSLWALFSLLVVLTCVLATLIIRLVEQLHTLRILSSQVQSLVSRQKDALKPLIELRQSLCSNSTPSGSTGSSSRRTTNSRGQAKRGIVIGALSEESSVPLDSFRYRG